MPSASQQYEVFTELAKGFCAAIEDPSIKGTSGLRVIHDLLLAVHAAALQLPEVSSEGDFKSSLEHPDWQTVHKDLQERLPIDIYWDTFDPLKDPPDDIVAGSVADDLGDIWRDLQSGFLELEAHGEASKTAVWWEWRFSFYSHWGAHSADALRVMYYAFRDS